jgi:hypothetical protein
MISDFPRPQSFIKDGIPALGSQQKMGNKNEG